MKIKLLLSLLFLFCIKVSAQVAVLPIYAQSTRPSQPGNEIAKSYDGSASSIYHSMWSVNAIPDTLDYYFQNVQDVVQLKYLPRPAGSSNGIWTKVDVYYTTNASPSTYVLSKSDVVLVNDATEKTIDLTATPINNPRIVRIIVKAGVGNFSSCAEMKFFSTVAQPAASTECTLPTAEFGAQARIFVDRTGVTVTANPVGENTDRSIEKTLDGDPATFYFSKYAVAVNETTPATLTYTFTQPAVMDGIKYTPRPNGGNGDFGKVEVWYKQDAATAEQLIATSNLEFSNSASEINFASRITDPYQIIVKVKTGANQNATCAEMEFYKIPYQDNLDLYPSVFNDLHSELKPNVDQTIIDGISSPYFKALAQCLLNTNTYNKKFRTQEFKPYPLISTVTASLKTAGACNVENPTGIVFKENTKAVIFVGAGTGRISLQTKDFAKVGTAAVKQVYTLHTGMNVIDILNDGLGYIDYFTDDANAQPIMVNITTGIVNGYYNPLVDTDEDWQNYVAGNAYNMLDIKGELINMNMYKPALAKNSYLSGKELLDAYEFIVKKEYQLMGLYKYNRVPKNHMFAWTPLENGLTGGGYGAHMGIGESGTGNASLFKKADLYSNIWGITHELGHINQIRPAFLWHGMTEVTNNIYSVYCQYYLSDEFGDVTRYEVETLQGPMADVYYPSIVGSQYNGYLNLGKINAKSVYEVVTDHDRPATRVATIPFWQLMMYYSIAGSAKGWPTLEERLAGTPAPAGEVDAAYWLPDFLEVCRNLNTSGQSDVQLMLKAISNICDVLHQDLTTFFVDAGYLRPVDKVVDDYGVKQITVTAQDIATTIAAIKAKNYPLASPTLNYISANSLSFYKNRSAMSGVTNTGVALNTNTDPLLTTLTINAQQWQNVVAFETYNQKTLMDVAIFGTGDATLATTLVRYPTNATSVYAVGYDGSRLLVYPAVDTYDALPVKLVSFEAKKATQGAVLTWKTASEQNNQKFEVYKKVGNADFVKIGERMAVTNATNGASYQFIDTRFDQDAYYFIKQIDHNGNSETFNSEQWIRFVKADLSVSTILYPNPATTSFAVKGSADNYSVKLIDVNGKLLRQAKSNGSRSTEINIADLSPGVYMVQIITDSGTETQKLIKY